MSTINALLDEMWESYISYTPSAAKIAKLFDEEIISHRLKGFNSFDIYAFFIVIAFMAVPFERGH